MKCCLISTYNRLSAGKASSSYLFNPAMAMPGKFYCGFAFLNII